MKELSETGIPRHSFYGIELVPMEAFLIAVAEIADLRRRVARLEGGAVKK